MNGIQTEYCAFVHKMKAEIQHILYWYDGFSLDSAVHLMELLSTQSTTKAIFCSEMCCGVQQK